MTELEKKLTIKERINLFEKQGRFNEEVVENPPSPELAPDKIDYLNKKFISKINTKIANFLAVSYFDKQIKRGVFTIKEIRGLDNIEKVKSGAIITCNHFSIYDHYAVYKAVNKSIKGNLYKVIREGNYTAFKGLFGYLFRHCNTLPLSTNIATMKKFILATKTLLNNGNKILLFPEQTMWPDYKKPRPLENGSFNLSVNNNVPIIPCFICTEDDSKNGKLYTINFSKPLYLDCALSKKENEKRLKEENYRIWKEIYEDFYKIPLSYGE